MPIGEIRAFTQCGVSFHLDKTFFIALPRPSNERLEKVKETYRLAKLTFDDDRDLVGREGRSGEGDADGFLIREIGVLTSQERAVVLCLGETTERGMALLEEFVRETLDIGASRFRGALQYMTYQTTTKVRFRGPVVRLLGSGLQAMFARWSDLRTKSLAAPMVAGEWPPRSAAMVHASSEYWERYFGGDAPQEGFVVPADLDFFAYLPTRFYKMTKYRLRVTVESLEAFLDNEYFVYSDLPFHSHMEMLEKLDEQMGKETYGSLGSA